MSAKSRQKLTSAFVRLGRNLDDAIYGIAIIVSDDYVYRVQNLMGAINQGGPFGWKKLSDSWLDLKRINGNRLEIWQATGDTKEAVMAEKPKRRSSSGVSVFAGIKGQETTPGPFASPISRALNVEFGGFGEYPKRPLFKPMAVKIAEDLKQVENGNYSSSIGRGIIKEISIAVHRSNRE